MKKSLIKKILIVPFGFLLFSCGNNTFIPTEPVDLSEYESIIIEGRESRDELIREFHPEFFDQSFGDNGVYLTTNNSGNFFTRGNYFNVDEEGNIYVAGYPSVSENILEVRKYTKFGERIMSFGENGAITSKNPLGHSIQYGTDNSIYLMLFHGIGRNLDKVMSIWKYDKNGILDEEFDKRGAIYQEEATFSLGVASRYHFVLDKENQLFVSAYNAFDTGIDYSLWKYKANGYLQRQFGEKGMIEHSLFSDDEFEDLGYITKIDNQGNIYIPEHGNGESINIWKYSSEGELDINYGNGGYINHAIPDSDTKYERAMFYDISLNGELYITGSKIIDNVETMVVWCYNSDGSINTSFGMSGYTVAHNFFPVSRGNSIEVNSNGDLTVCGYIGNGTDWDMAVWKFDSLGTQLQNFSDNGVYIFNDLTTENSDDRAYNIKTDSTGSIYISGSSQSNSSSDMIVIKLSSNGFPDTNFARNGVLRMIDFSGCVRSDSIKSLAIDFNHHFFSIGTSNNGNNYDLVLKKYTHDQNSTNFAEYGTSIYNSGFSRDMTESGYGVTTDLEGNIFVTGYTGSGFKKDLIVQKYKPDGTLDQSFAVNGTFIHNNAAGGDANDIGYDIILDPVGNIYITGESWGSRSDMVIWKLTPEGKLDTTFAEKGYVVSQDIASEGINDIGYSILSQNGIDIYVAGCSYSGTDYELVIWKYDSSGNLNTSFGEDGVFRYKSDSGKVRGEESIAYDIVFDRSGNILIAGDNSNGHNIDMAIWNIDSDGNLINSFGNNGIVVDNDIASWDSMDAAKSLVLDLEGNIYLAGYSDEMMVVWKYDSNGNKDLSFGEDGRVIWPDGEANDILFGADNKLLIAGSSMGNMAIWSISNY